MNEAEALEAIAAFSANGINAFTVYISFTFAYLAVSYLAGARLNRAQAISASVLYVFAAASAIGANFTNTHAIGLILEEYGTVLKGASGFNMDAWSVYMILLMTAGIVASLYFMWGVRKNDADKTDA